MKNYKDMGCYYFELISRMILAYGNYDYADECEMVGYRAAVHKMLDYALTDYRQYCRDLEKVYEDQYDKNSDNV